MRVAISVNEEGLATRVRTIEATFSKGTVAVDGKEIPAYELFEPVVSVFYKGGRFMRRYQNGKPVAYEAEVELAWRFDHRDPAG